MGKRVGKEEDNGRARRYAESEAHSSFKFQDHREV